MSCFYIYNPKWNVWSELPAKGCPVVAYVSKLLVLAHSGEIYEFLSQSGRWEISESLDPKVDPQSRLTEALVLFAVQAISCSSFMALKIQHKMYNQHSFKFWVGIRMAWGSGQAPGKQQLKILSRRQHSFNVTMVTLITSNPGLLLRQT